MANAAVAQILEDGPRYTVVKLSYVLDTSDLAETVVCDPAAHAAFENGTLPTKYAILAAHWSTPGTLQLRLQWKATTNTEAIALSQSEDIECFDAPIKNNAGSGVNGQLVAITNGWSTGTWVGFVLLKLLKNP